MIFAYVIAGATIVTVALAIYHRDSEYLFIGLMFGLLLVLSLFLFVLIGSCIAEAVGAPTVSTISEPMELYTIGDKNYIIISSDYYSYCYNNKEDGVTVDKKNKAVCRIRYSDIDEPYCEMESCRFENPILNFLFPLDVCYTNFYIPEGTVGISNGE